MRRRRETDSTVSGVRLRTITYSFRDLPHYSLAYEPI